MVKFVFGVGESEEFLQIYPALHKAVTRPPVQKFEEGHAVQLDVVL